MKVRTFKCTFCSSNEKAPCINTIVYKEGTEKDFRPLYCPLESNKGEADWREVDTIAALGGMVLKFLGREYEICEKE